MTTNVTPFLNNSLERLLKARADQSRIDLTQRKIEGDVTVKREALRLVSSQETNKFNPLPGNFSTHPQRDLADQRGPDRFGTVYAEAKDAIGKLPMWATTLIMAVVIFVIVRGMKRG